MPEACSDRPANFNRNQRHHSTRASRGYPGKTRLPRYLSPVALARRHRPGLGQDAVAFCQVATRRPLPEDVAGPDQGRTSANLLATAFSPSTARNIPSPMPMGNSQSAAASGAEWNQVFMNGA